MKRKRIRQLLITCLVFGVVTAAAPIHALAEETDTTKQEVIEMPEEQTQVEQIGGG